MKDNFKKNRIKMIKDITPHNCGYTWVFSNGVETVHNDNGYRRKLMQMFKDSPSPSLVLKSSSKVL